MDQNQERKLDDILAGLNQLKPQVADTKSEVHFLRKEVSEIKLNNVRQDGHIENMKSYLDGIGRKLRDHVGDRLIHKDVRDAFTNATVRWKFIAQVFAAITGFTTIIVMITRFIPK